MFWTVPALTFKRSFMQMFPFPRMSHQHVDQKTLGRPELIEAKHIGNWCVVNFDKAAYPGVIMDVEAQSVKVKSMHRNGINKFYWPGPCEDWQVLCLIAFCTSAWKYVQQQLQNCSLRGKGDTFFCFVL